MPLKHSRAVEALERQQRSALSLQDFALYKRQWVALRDGEVIASNESGVVLRHHPEVRSGDILMPVPPRGTAVWFSTNRPAKRPGDGP